MNGVVSILALMGIAVAASELPLAFRKRETLLGKQRIYGAWNVTNLLRYHENGRSFCKSKATSRSSCLVITGYVLHYLRVSPNNVYVLSNQSFRILFNYLNEYLHDVQKDNFELGKGNINVFVVRQHRPIKPGTSKNVIVFQENTRHWCLCSSDFTFWNFVYSQSQLLLTELSLLLSSIVKLEPLLKNRNV